MNEKETYTASVTNPSDGLPLRQRIWAVIAICFAMSMSGLDTNITNVVLPTLSQQFGTSPSATTWIINGYQLAIVVSLLSFSSMGEIFGYRGVFLTGIAMFCVTSLACALATSFWSLTIARVLQGLSASAITSVNTAQLRTIYPSNQLGRGLGINAMIIAISAAAGPSIASAILSVGTWHWLFAINIPIGLVALILGWKFLPKKEERAPRKFDTTSAIANAVTFGLLFYTLDGFAHQEQRKFLVIQIIILAIVGTYYIRRQLGQKAPLLPLDLLRVPSFTLSISTSVCSFTAQMLAMVSLPFFLQNTLGHSEVMTGLLLTPWPLAALVAAPTAGYLVERIHPGVLGSIGMVLFGVGLFSLSLLHHHSTPMDIVWRMALCGLGFAVFQTPNNSMILAAAPTNRSGAASGMLGMARLLGQTTGTALVALLFSFVAHDKSTFVCLWVACGFAVAAAVVSSLRLKQPAK